MVLATNKQFFIFLLGLLFLVPPVAAQERVTEEEVNIQKVFIDANRERLLGNYDESLALYERVLKDDRDNDAAHYEMARLYEIKEEFEKAIKSVQKAMELVPENEWYKKYAGDLYQKTGRDEDAAKIYKDLVKQTPNEDYYYYKWAYFLVRANKIDDALDVYEQLEDKVGLNEELVRRKHSLYLGIGDQDKAAEELRRLIEAFPKVTDYRHLLANFYQQIGEDEKAVAVYKEILTLDPDDQKAQIGALAEKANGQSQEFDYLNSLSTAFRDENLSIDLKIEKIIPFIRKVADTGDPALADAVLQLTEILETVHPDDAKGFSASGDLLYYSNRRTQAIEKYKKTLKLNDSVFAVWEQLLYALEEEHRYEELAETAEEAMDLFPNKAIISYFSGLAQYQLGQYKKARNDLDMALLMAGNNGRLQYDVQSQLGLTLQALKDYPAADKAFEAALRLNAKSPQVLSDYSYALAQRGEQLQKAKNMAKQANELLPNQSSYEHSYGWVLYKAQEYKQAADWLKKAAENNTDKAPDTFEHYGDVLYQLGEVDLAVKYWVEAQENGSSSDLLDKKIADRKLYE